MTLPITASFDELLIEVGNGANPEVFTKKCGLTQKSTSITAATASSEVPDCDDESLPSTVLNSVKSVSEEITGSGILPATDYAYWRAWALSGAQKNVRLTIAKPQANGGGYWITPYVLSSFKNAVSKGEEVTVDITLSSAGALGAFVPADETP